MFVCTLKSTVAFSSLFLFLDITFLLLAIAQFQATDGVALAGTNKAAGVFGLITAFIAWWNAMAGLLESSNSFFTIPVCQHHFLRKTWSRANWTSCRLHISLGVRQGRPVRRPLPRAIKCNCQLDCFAS